MSTLAQRVLPGMEDGAVDAILIVAEYGAPSEIRLSLTAPGLEQLDKLRTQLCTLLKTSLDPEWVYDVTLEHETGDLEIVVAINDSQLLGDHSVDLVLGAAKAFVAPFAAKHWRSVYTLRGEQRLVPLDFEQLADSIRVILPKPLSLRPPKRFVARQLTRESLGGHEDDMDSLDARCSWLNVALELAFDQHEWVANTAVRQSEKGVLVDVTFDLRLSSTPFNIGVTQRVVMEVLKQHVTFADINSDLVFVSDTLASDYEHDDGDDDYYDDEY